MTGPWKGGKSKSSFPHLPTAPWKSGPTGQDSHIPVSRLLLRKQKREQKQQTLTDDQSVNHAPGLKCQLSPRLYIHAVPSGLLRAPGEVAHCRWSSVNASGAVQIGRSKKPIWTSLEQQPPKTNGGNCAVH
jgi:hypothetical protein